MECERSNQETKKGESTDPMQCYRTGGDVDIAIGIGTGAVTPVVIFPPSPRPWAADVLNPNCRMAANKSAFWTGFAKYVANRLLLASCASEAYALTAMIGVLAFLLLVVLMYLAAPSPSTIQPKWNQQLVRQTRELMNLRIGM